VAGNRWNGGLTPALEGCEQALRCEDVATAMSGAVATRDEGPDLGWTRRVGTAAAVAATIRGERFVPDAPALRHAVPALTGPGAPSLREVLEVLEVLEVVTDIERRGDTVVSFAESVPDHGDLYGAVGDLWRAGATDERELVFVALVHRLATGPVAADVVAGELGLECDAAAALIEVGRDLRLVDAVATADGEVLYSPLLTFEHPEAMFDVLVLHGPERLQGELGALRRHQGLPVSSAEFPALHDAVGRGLVTAPSLACPSHDIQPFACLPTTGDGATTDVERIVTTKALALLSCVRAAQRFDGSRSFRSPQDVLDWLLLGARPPTPGREAPGAGHDVMLARARLLECVVAGDALLPVLIATEDNVAAVELARDLLILGDPLEVRPGVSAEAPAVLTRPGEYLTPLQTVQRHHAAGPPDRGLERALTVLVGRSQLELALADVMGRAPL